VDQDDASVARQLGVAFDGARALVGGEREGGERVLGRMAGGAAMGNHADFRDVVHDPNRLRVAETRTLSRPAGAGQGHPGKYLGRSRWTKDATRRRESL
jgi:hypothetical protein